MYYVLYLMDTFEKAFLVYIVLGIIGFVIWLLLLLLMGYIFHYFIIKELKNMIYSIQKMTDQIEKNNRILNSNLSNISTKVEENSLEINQLSEICANKFFPEDYNKNE